jgi:hypothetical protein
MKISEIILLPKQDRRLKRTSGSRRHVTRPVTPGAGNRSRQAGRCREADD